jgi:hypothetical protein
MVARLRRGCRREEKKEHRGVEKVHLTGLKHVIGHILSPPISSAVTGSRQLVHLDRESGRFVTCRRYGKVLHNVPTFQPSRLGRLMSSEGEGDSGKYRLSTGACFGLTVFFVANVEYHPARIFAISNACYLRVQERESVCFLLPLFARLAIHHYFEAPSTSGKPYQHWWPFSRLRRALDYHALCVEDNKNISPCSMSRFWPPTVPEKLGSWASIYQ